MKDHKKQAVHRTESGDHHKGVHHSDSYHLKVSEKAESSHHHDESGYLRTDLGAPTALSTPPQRSSVKLKTENKQERSRERLKNRARMIPGKPA
jgi:hypothetical protein